MILGTDGAFYGETEEGGDIGNKHCYQTGCGTIFRATPQGVVSQLHKFEYTDGWVGGSVVKATQGYLIGTTSYGGASDGGTVFKLSTGLGPFVSFVHNSGKVGQRAGILGQGFTGATQVSFHGTPARFTVESDTLLLAIVPRGATTGRAEVKVGDQTLTSNTPFYILP
jgi:uncharacterized repeat protein (TIGR03803 family)